MSDEKLTCSKCNAPMALIHISLGPSKDFHRNFECPICQDAIEKVSEFHLSDLSDPQVLDWLRSGLRPSR